MHSRRRAGRVRAACGRSGLERAARSLFTEPEDPGAFGPAVEQLGAALRHLRLDAAPRRATEEELSGFGGPVAVLASEHDALFPARAVLLRARGIFHDLALTEVLEGCRHAPSMAVLGRVNERILAFLTGPDGAQSCRWRRLWVANVSERRLYEVHRIF